MARDVLNCLISGENRITTGHIKKLVCTYYKVSEEMLESKSRKKIHSHPRNIYAYLCRRYTDETLGNIARSINRSHSTVLYAAELVEHRRKRDRNIRHQLDFLCRKLTDP
jgi:chromosomal replication initiator protein